MEWEKSFGFRHLLIEKCCNGYLTEGVGAGRVRGGHEGLEADLAHEVLIHLQQANNLSQVLVDDGKIIAVNGPHLPKTYSLPWVTKLYNGSLDTGKVLLVVSGLWYLLAC